MVSNVEPWSVTKMRPLYVSVAVVLCRRVLTRNRLRVRAEKNTLSMLWDKVRECAYHASLGSERQVAECWHTNRISECAIIPLLRLMLHGCRW